MSPMPAGARVVSLTEFSSGGLIDDQDLTILDAKFCMYDYAGKTDDGQPKLTLGLQLQDEEGKEHEQYYSAGDAEYFMPSDDGYVLWAIKDRQKVSDNTNAATFLNSVLACGFPQAILDTGVDKLIGMKGHFKRAPQKQRSGLIRNTAQAGKKREDTTLLLEKIISLPGQSAPGKAVAGGLGKATATATKTATRAATPAPSPVAQGVAASSSNGSGELTDEATLGLLTILEAAGGSIPKAKLSIAAFKQFTGNAQKATLVKMVCSEEFLGTMEGITYDGAVVSMA